MAIYRNDTTETIRTPEIELAAGAQGAPVNGAYLLNPVAGLTLIQETRSPWDVFSPSDISGDGETIDNLQKYKKLIIINRSGADVMFSVNNSGQAFPIADGESWPILEARDIGKVTVAGTGTAASVYVVAIW
jgi:hypothetical protein